MQCHINKLNYNIMKTNSRYILEQLYAFFQKIFPLTKYKKEMSKIFESAFPPDSKTIKTCESLYWFPQYLDEGPFKSEYDFEWKRYLLLKNFEEIKTSTDSKKRFAFYTPKIAKCVFNVCKMFRQPPEVRYLALDVLDRFLVEHFFKVSKTFEEMKDCNAHSWQEVVERMLKQSPLRILSSVQLAMKYSWSCNVITATEIQETLEFLGHNIQYPKKSILKSEARIYKHLNYNVSYKTPFTYIEMFFNDFQKHECFSINISLHNFFIMCIHVLDVAIIFHQQIYESLSEIHQDSFEDSSIRNFSVVSFKANFVLLAASVIFATSVLEDPTAVTPKILLGILCSIGECKKSEIQALGQQIVDIILRLSS